MVKIQRLARLQFLRHYKAQRFQGTPAQFKREWQQTTSYLKENTLKLQLKGIDKQISVLKLIFAHSYDRENKS